MHGHIHASPLVNNPALDFQHRIVKDLYPVQVIFYQIFLDQLIKLLCIDLPDADAFLVMAEKQFQTLIFFCQLQYLRNPDCKSGKKISEFTAKGLCDIRSFSSLELQKLNSVIAISQKFKLIYFSFRMCIPSIQAQNMSMSVIVTFFIYAETKIFHVLSPTYFS